MFSNSLKVVINVQMIRIPSIADMAKNFLKIAQREITLQYNHRGQGGLQSFKSC